MIAPDMTESASKLRSKERFRQLCALAARLGPASTQYELLQRMAVGRHEAAVAARGHDDLTDVQGAARVEANIVRGKEVTRRAGIGAAAPAGKKFTVAREHADAASRRIRRRRLPGKQARSPTHLCHECSIRAVDAHLHRPGHVGPLFDELAIRREDL